MGQAITITNLDHSAADLRRLMSREKDGAVVRRLLALSRILEGKSRTEAAEQSGMERQTLRDWGIGTMSKVWLAFRRGLALARRRC